MSLTLTDSIRAIAETDLFKRDDKTKEFMSGRFVGRPFHLEYDRAHILVADAWKAKANGLPQGAFLLAYYEGEESVQEALLLRVIRPTKLPTDSDVIGSMIEYYKENLNTTGSNNQLDTFTRYEFSFSGLECRVLGTFYKHGDQAKTVFGADLENYYSAHNYSIVKPGKEALELIVNFREGKLTGAASDIRIGSVRYSSSRRFHEQEEEAVVFVSPGDFLGKRTALFGMTRTGKSNTVKKIIQATVAISEKATHQLKDKADKVEELLDPFTDEGLSKYPVGQIVFDINGEYANANLQDDGTAIYEMFTDITTRYSTVPKPGFDVMKVNFYKEPEAGFELVRSHLGEASGDYVESFRAVDMTKPEDYDTNTSVKTRYDRRLAAYLCCLRRAGFPVTAGFEVEFSGNKDLNEIVREDSGIDPKKGISLDDAITWFTAIWDEYESNDYFRNYRKSTGHEWADEELKAILVFLTRKRTPGRSINVSGYLKLRGIIDLHAESADEPYDKKILRELRDGHIVIIDLSQGNPEIQRLYSERICRRIFMDSMKRFVETDPNNFVQFYFEEAHNLFPKKDDKDLSQIYNRLAKEGAKLNLGLMYATQEVSSISANILKNTQNWFIAHLNNEDETKEIRKYYDFGDFSDSLIRFSATSDKGFVRMKTYSNPFVVPVQIDRFLAERGNDAVSK